ncbi:MAG: tyrosine-type recombinase/integrase [Methylocystis sp.]
MLTIPQGFESLEATSLYSRAGARKYLNAEELDRLLEAIGALPTEERLFALTLFWTGARISEVLALRRLSFQIHDCLVTVRTLKRRRFSIREIPLPPDLVAAIGQHFRLDQCGEQRLWPWSRTKGWRIFRRVMHDAGLSGVAACPRGVRHSFAIAALRSQVPLTLLQKWLGHARLSTTAIYLGATGPEEREFAERFWKAIGH